MSTMLSELETRPVLSGNEGSFGDEFEKDIGLLLREQQRRRQESDDRDREELNMCRSGSAPPTVEGSLTAVGGLFGQRSAGDSPEIASKRDGNGFVSEEDLRSDPAYLSYYYSNSHLNPRLPPPLVSKEDWRSAQRRLQGGSSSVLGGIGDRRRRVSRPENGGGSRSRASMPPGFDLPREESEPLSDKSSGGGGGAEWDSNGLIGLSGLGLGSRKQSIAEVFQNDLGRATPVSGHPSRPVSRNAFEESTENLASSQAELSHLPLEFTSTEALLPSTNVQGSSLIPDALQQVGQSASYNYASVLGALSRSTTPDPQLVARAPSPCRTPIGGGRAVASEKRSVNSPNSYNGISLGRNESADLSVTLSSLNISANGMVDEEHHLPSQIEQDVDIHQNYFLNLQGAQNHMKRQVEQHRHTVPLGNSPAKRSSMPITNGGRGMHSQYQHADGMNSSYPNYDLSGYTINSPLTAGMTNHIGTCNMPPLYENVAAASAMDSKALGGCLGLGGQNRAAVISESQTLSGMRNQLGGNALQAPFMDPMYLQYMRTAEYAAAQGLTLNDPPVDMNYMGNSYLDLLGLQKAYLGTLMSSQKSQYGVPLGSKSTGSNHLGLYGNPSYGVGISYPGSPLESPGIHNSFVGHGSTIRHNELDMRLPTGMRNLPTQPWHLDGGCNVDENFSSSLLEEFKSNKTNCFELSDIAGHVFEFSADQYGSRFIQQKLETATIEDKNMVFQEIMPHALSLMTDVFGNYVVQKFFEHGATSQIRELANKLIGRVLTLSLQMYGCRVIQKAIEVVDVDQKIKMVEELDSHVMRCVRDQNGNHVIQKSIECVPEESIQFIVTTFFDQVVNLSTHPYGCRVIQRILEHCEDPKTQKKIMDEILGSVSMLAQDQYGNYVIQHVLEHGKSHERSAIIEELAGKIVQMSQQKFASNVVEKCLTFGDPSQREILVNEMLGSTDENEPLQAMMKDQFANYVVQKVLETCEDQHRELILSRIKVHLNALKKYTYGKHIVARVEKLVAAGERRIAAQSSHPS